MDIGIVTGASAGLGREFATQIDSRYNLDELWVIARRKTRLNELADRLTTPVRVLDMDLTNPENIQHIQTKLSQERYHITLLVNNAGFGKRGNFLDIPINAQLGMIDVNIRALVHLTYICLPYLQEGDRVIQVASAAGFLPSGKFSVYAASKAFAIHFANGIAAELEAQGITVTAVCPGPVDTEFQQAAWGGNATNSTLPVAPADKVVEKALHDAEKGRWFSIYGFSVKLLPLLVRLASRRYLAKAAMKHR